MARTRHDCILETSAAVAARSTENTQMSKRTKKTNPELDADDGVEELDHEISGHDYAREHTALTQELAETVQPDKGTSSADELGEGNASGGNLHSGQLTPEKTRKLKQWEAEIFEGWDDSPEKAHQANPTQRQKRVDTSGHEGDSRRRSTITNLTISESWHKLFSKNEMNVPASMKLTDEDIALDMNLCFPEGKFPSFNPFDVDDVKAQRFRYNKGRLWAQRVVQHEDGKVDRLDVKLPKQPSRRYIRLKDGRVYVIGTNGKHQGEYRYEETSATKKLPKSEAAVPSAGGGAGKIRRKRAGRGHGKGRTKTEHSESPGYVIESIQNVPGAAESNRPIPEPPKAAPVVPG